MSNSLTYGIGLAGILLLLNVWIARRRWARASKLCSGHQELRALIGPCTDAYVSSWMHGIVSGVGFFALGMLCSFLTPASARDGLRVINLYWLPGMIWAVPGSWTGLFLKSVRNTLFVLGDGPPPPFVAYLRDRTEELREEIGGMPGQETVSPIQRGIRRLNKSIPAKCLFGFWDPGDKRSGVLFSPLISPESSWKHNVTALCERATAIVLDVSTFSPSVVWEARLIGGRADLAVKTLVFRAQNDEAPPPELAHLIKAVRWLVEFDSREKEGGSEPLELPADFVQTLQPCLQHHR